MTHMATLSKKETQKLQRGQHTFPTPSTPRPPQRTHTGATLGWKCGDGVVKRIGALAKGRTLT